MIFQFLEKILNLTMPSESSMIFSIHHVDHRVMVHHLFITNLRGYQNSPKDRGYSDRVKMTSKFCLLETGYDLDKNF